jgi:REP element-mobilizing transposase RayT
MRDISIKTRHRSIRLQGYDYAQEGMYFFTVCTYKRQLLFGDVGNGEVKLNDFGHVVCDEWRKSTDIRREIALDAFVVMPNHVHGIVMVTDRDVGATGRSPFLPGPPKHSLGSFIAGLKAAVTKRINEVRGTPKAPVWQRNYYEHVIRNEESLQRIREYILNNPAQWDLDPENPEAKGDRPVAPTNNINSSLSRSGV